ncbi:MAG: radical SAM family heme chaperone HemW [Actinomycetaceae bacterium]|nr:radical SAM family heme chaperone HemW [Actinomycetaceae bacterium]MDY6083125.1 radical SAM family heme chaperone HemW [Actinomycetaceae bacterium]
MQLPEGETAPRDGTIPDPNVTDGFAAYVHIPFCRVRCGYCDFNTYTQESFGPGAGRTDFNETLKREIDLSARVLNLGEQSHPERTEHAVHTLNAGFTGKSGSYPGAYLSQVTNGLPDEEAGVSDGLLTSVFFGGGTPTLVSAEQLTGILAYLRSTFGLRVGAEVTSEANPDTVTEASVHTMAEGGFTRLSVGMQSAVPRVLQILDRVHTPENVERAVTWAHNAGMDTSVDLIYGTPSETRDEWRASLSRAIDLGVDHISCYALTIEPGTKMGQAIRRGTMEAPDPDDQADKYELAESMLCAAGYRNYEISNWAHPGHESRHNMAYWTGANWWGYGPGAHSHINGTRFWNVKHPLAYAQRLQAGVSPAAGREILTLRQRDEEELMLAIRLREGLQIPDALPGKVIAGFLADGLIDAYAAMQRHRIVLTVKGRLLADSVTRTLWEALL